MDRRLRVVVVLVIGSAAAPWQAEADGTIDVTGASFIPGDAPTIGAVVQNACAGPSAPPELPTIAPIGSIGTMTGSLPAFPGAGDGSGGDFTASEGTPLDGGTYDFASYTVPRGVTVTYTGPVTIRTTGDVSIGGALATSASGASITIQCGGTFHIDGDTGFQGRVRTTGPGSSVSIFAGQDFSGPGFGGIDVTSGDVAISAHGLAADTGNVNLSGTFVSTGTGSVTVRAAAAVVLQGGEQSGNAYLNTGTGDVLVQAFGSSITVLDSAYVNIGTGQTLVAEAAGRILLSNDCYFNTRDGAISVTAFGGDLEFFNGCYANTLNGAVTLRARDSVLLTLDSYANASTGSMTVTAYTGDVGLETEAIDGCAYVETANGDITVRAARNVVMHGDSSIDTEEGSVTVEAVGGFVEIEDCAELNAETGGMVVRAADRLTALSADSEPGGIESDGDMSLFAGAGGIDLDRNNSTRANNGSMTILAVGPVRLRDSFLALGDISVTSCGAGVDIQTASLTTANFDGDTSDIDVASYAGVLGSISAQSAVIHTGTAALTSGDIRFEVFTAAKTTEVSSYLLPAKATGVVKTNVTKSSFTATGTLDTGPATDVDLAGPLTVEVGDVTIPVPGLTLKKGALVFKGEGLQLKLKSSKDPTSRRTFKATYKGDLGGAFDREGVVALRIAGDAFDARSTIDLSGGKFKLGKQPGALDEPALYLTSVVGKLAGDGADTLSIIGGRATDGVAPATAVDVRIAFGESFDETIPSASFTRQGGSDVFSSKTGRVRSLLVDHVRGTIALNAAGIELGAFEDGSYPIRVLVSVGSQTAAVNVVVSKKGTTLRY